MAATSKVYEFQRGQSYVFKKTNMITLKNGDRVVAVGSGTRPLMICDEVFPFKFDRGASVSTIENITIEGLHFYNPYRDPNNPLFDDTKLESGQQVFSSLSNYGNSQDKEIKNILITNCRFNFVQLVFQNRDSVKPIENVKLYRNVIQNGLGIGLYTYKYPIIIDSNVFDHNGWNEQIPTEGANMFEHNMYLSTIHNTKVINNIVARSSSIGVKCTSFAPGQSPNVEVSNNFICEGQVAISMGGNYFDHDNDPNTPKDMAVLRFVNPRVTDNVFYNIGKTKPDGRDFSWGMEALDWDGGLIARNIMYNDDTLLPTPNQRFIIIGRTSRDIDVMENIALNMNSTHGIFRFDDNISTNITLRKNKVNTTPTSLPVVFETVKNPSIDIDSTNDFVWTPQYKSVDGRKFKVGSSSYPIGQVYNDMPNNTNLLDIPFNELLDRWINQGEVDGVWDESITANTLNERIRAILGV